MAPLSLEQVLARSMRLPRQRARHQVSSLFSSSHAGAEVTYRSHPPPAAAGRQPRGAPPARQHAQRLSFFQLMDAQDAQRRAGHLSIQRAQSGALVRNSADLLTFLVTAQRMGDWQDALQAFLKATETALETEASSGGSKSALRLVRAPPTPVRTHSHSSSAPSAPSPPHSTPDSEAMPVSTSLEHVRAVLDACADDGQWPVVVALCQFYGTAFPALLAHATTRVVNSPAVDDAHGTPWQRGLRFLTEELSLPPADIPVEAFNVCLSACEAAKDWRGALTVIRHMGANPLQSLTLDGEAPAAAGTSAAPDADVAGAHGPAPDVVSYATVIATLEQAGKSALVPQVLNRLPPVEKEEITASYAALIYVWSNQVYGKQNRRF